MSAILLTKEVFLFEDIHIFLEDIALLCLEIANLEQLDCERYSVGASANSHCSMLGLGNVRNVVKTTLSWSKNSSGISS